MNLQPVAMLGLQLLQLLSEDDPVLVGVAVEQGEAALRLAPQGGHQDAQDGRDAASRREGHVVLLVGRIAEGVEVAHGGHHLQGVTGLELLHELRAGPSAMDALHGDPQPPLLEGAAADAVAAPQLLPVHLQFQGQVLAMDEAEILTQVLRDPESDGDGILGLALHIGHFERVESGHLLHGSFNGGRI